MKLEKEPSSPVHNPLGPLAFVAILSFATIIFRRPTKKLVNSPGQTRLEPPETPGSIEECSGIRGGEGRGSAGTVAVSEIAENGKEGNGTTNRDTQIQRLRKAGGEWLSVVTVVVIVAYTFAAFNQWKEMIKATYYATKTADAAQKQLELSERPWMKIVDVKTAGDNPILPALSFQKIGPFNGANQQATFQVVVSLKNIGHSVADVVVSSELLLPTWDGSRFQDEISSEQKRFCDSPEGKALQRFYPKFVVFPDEPFEWHGALTRPINAEMINHLPGHGEIGYVLPVIVVCANYHLRTLEHSYQTRTIYEVFHQNDRTRFFKIGEGIPAHRIVLLRNELADDAY